MMLGSQVPSPLAMPKNAKKQIIDAITLRGSAEGTSVSALLVEGVSGGATLDAHLVPVRVKAAVGRPESRKQASGQIKPEFSGVPALEQAIRRTRIQARDEVRELFAGEQHHRQGNAGIAAGVRVSVCERKPMHRLPAAER